MNQEAQGYFLRHKESPGMIIDTTRLHKTSFQEVEILKILKILSKIIAVVPRLWSDSKAEVDTIGIYVKKTINVENYSFGYGLTILGALPLAEGEVCEALSSHENTRTPPEIIRNQCS